jgi:adenylate cyclase
VTLTLDDLVACFEGVIPSIIATSAAEGIPNVSYLSHVARVDAHHVAISNQFFAKTAANVRANPQASLMLVDGRSGRQYALDLHWERSVDRGELFERVERDLRASSAQVGMGDVMRLRALDIFRVLGIEACPSPATAGAPAEPTPPSLPQLTGHLARIAAQASVDDLFDALLDAAHDIAGADHAMIAIHEPAQAKLVIAGSAGYAQPGTGSEIPVGSLLIGEAAAAMLTFKHSDLSRIRRLAGAAAADAENEDRTRTIALPFLPEALSQIAVPMASQGKLLGVLFVESTARLAFDREIEAALEAVALQGAAVLALLDRSTADGDAADAPAPIPPPRAAPRQADIRIAIHAFDDSVFVDDRYVIKGVAGRLLVFLVERSLAEARAEFSNREIRLAAELRLPDFKDNLETRLLLLRRRLEERALPIRLIRTDRGRMRLEIDGIPTIERRP